MIVATIVATSPARITAADATPAASQEAMCMLQRLHDGMSIDLALVRVARFPVTRSDSSASGMAPQHGHSCGIANRREETSTSTPLMPRFYPRLGYNRPT